MSSQTTTDSSVLIRGIEMGVIEVLLHHYHLQLELVSGDVEVGVRSSFPVPNVHFIMGNDIAGGKV